MTTITRRGFFSRLFGGKEEPPPTHSFIGLQVVLMHDARTTIRDELQALIYALMEPTPAERRRFYKRLLGLLQGTQPFFEFGYVEVIASDEADENFHEWVTDIENSLATEAEEGGDGVDAVYRHSNEKRFIALSLAFYIEGRHRGFSDLEDDDPRRYTRHGMWELLQEVSRLNYDRVISDAVFLSPANNTDGFSVDDLHSEGWEYLLSLS